VLGAGGFFLSGRAPSSASKEVEETWPLTFELA
jgi:hypothetical protein